MQGDELRRTARLGSAPTIEFETDVDNTYFDRSDNPDLLEGEWRVYRKDCEPVEVLPGCRMDGPRDGIAVLHIKLPPESVIGSELSLEVEVGDDTMPEPFVNRLTLKVTKPGEAGGGGGRSTSANRGRGERGGASNLELPEIFTVREADWKKDFHTFTEDDALWVLRTPGEDERDQLDFYVNVDNKFLKTVQKAAGKKRDPSLLERQFMYANVLIGMAMLNSEGRDASGADEGAEESTGSIEERINRVTTALAPIILPMIDVLATLALEDVAA
jgi:hypothetical protein